MIADGLKMARVDFGGVVRRSAWTMCPRREVGDYCLVHVGFALNLLSETEALETLALLDEIAAHGARGNRSGE